MANVNTNSSDLTQNDEPELSPEAAAAAAEAAAANLAREEAKKLNAATAPYIVASGGSVSCLRGIVDAGEPLQELDFVRGKRDLDDLVARGAVIKRAKAKTTSLPTE